MHFLGYLFGYEDGLACFKPKTEKTETDLFADDDDDDWEEYEDAVEDVEVVEEEEEEEKGEEKCKFGLVKHLNTIERQTEIR